MEKSMKCSRGTVILMYGNRNGKERKVLLDLTLYTGEVSLEV